MKIIIYKLLVIFKTFLFYGAHVSAVTLSLNYWPA